MKKIFTLIAVAVMALAAQAGSLTICEGQYYSNSSPLCGLYADEVGSMTQSIYPATMLEDVAGNQITKMTFYTLANYYEVNGTVSGDETDYINFDGAKFQLALLEVDQLGFTEAVAVVGATAVATTVPEEGDIEVVFELDEPFEYNGGNLLVEVTCIETEGDWGQTYFWGDGVEDYDCSYYSISGQEQTSNFLPKVTIDYEPAEVTPVEPSGQTAAPEIVTTPADDVYTITGQVKEGDPEAVVTLYVVNEDGEEVAVENPLVIPRVDEDQYVTIVAYAHIDGQNDGRTEIIVFIPKRIITGVDELISGKDVSSVRYYNLAGQEMAQPSGLTIMVTTYTDGTSSAVKVIK